ncbi:MAG: acyltransferase [Armatimonadetes bacterium]|nr:acyltransferase [Armatimonadota bacterium]
MSTKLEFIEGMRAVAALYVVIGHFCGMVDAKFLDTGKSIASPLLQALMSPFWHGHLAVAAFIVLSGFSLQYGLYQRGDGRVYGLGKFFKRRALRILPAYYACLGLSYLVCQYVTIPNGNVPPFRNYVPISKESLWAHIFLVHNWSVDWLYKINGVLWSIAIEFQLYLVFPFMILIMQKRSPLTLLILTIIPTVLVVNYLPGAGKTYTWFAILFVLGMMAAHFSYRPSLKIGPKAGTGIFLSLVGVAITAKIVMGALSQGKIFDTPTLISSDITFGLSTATLLYAMTVAPGSWIERFFSLKWLVRIGIFSYSLYLLHHPLLQIFYVHKPAWVLGSEMTMGYLLLAALPSILIISWLFSFIFERPFVKSRLPMREAARVAVERIPLPLRALNGVEAAEHEEGYAYLSAGASKKAREPLAISKGSPKSRAKLL